MTPENTPAEQPQDATTEVASVGNVFTNMKIARKIGAASALILCFLAVVAVVAYFGLSGANGNFKEYRSYARQTNQLGRVQANLLLARLYAKDFILKNTEEAADKVRQRVAATVDLIDESKALFDRPEAIEGVDQAASHIRTYQENFETVTDLVQQRNGLVAQMNEVGPKSERSLTEIMKSAYEDGDASASYRAGITLRHLLLARLYSNRFLVDNLPASEQRAQEELSGFQETAKSMLAELQNPRRRALASKGAATHSRRAPQTRCRKPRAPGSSAARAPTVLSPPGAERAAPAAGPRRRAAPPAPSWRRRPTPRRRAPAAGRR